MKKGLIILLFVWLNTVAWGVFMSIKPQKIVERPVEIIKEVEKPIVEYRNCSQEVMGYCKKTCQQRRMSTVSTDSAGVFSIF